MATPPVRQTQLQRTSIGQPKAMGGSPVRKPPTTPPAYRPQPVPIVLQLHSAKTTAHETRQTPKAPPAYRPQPVPKVLQRKSCQPPPAASPVRQPVAAVREFMRKGIAPRHAQPGLRNSPAAQPVARPEPKKGSRPNSVAAQVHRPQLPIRRPPAGVAQRRIAPPAAFGRSAVVQRANNSTRGITSEIGAINEDLFHEIKQRLYGRPDVSHRILQDGTIDPIGVNIFVYASSHPKYKMVFSSPESQGNYTKWQKEHPEEYQKLTELALEHEEKEERQSTLSKQRRDEVRNEAPKGDVKRLKKLHARKLKGALPGQEEAEYQRLFDLYGHLIPRK